MSLEKKQELLIVESLSSATLSPEMIKESNIPELIRDIAIEKDELSSNARRLERLRREKKDGNFIGNWWNDRDDKVADAQLDLNKSIGRLTEKSSKLLVLNTAISKVLYDQQKILIQQQKTLEQQTATLKEQNNKIFNQQKTLEKQQAAINQANQGLLEAKGLTQEQAQKLVGCVKRIEEAEKRLKKDNIKLIQQCEDAINNAITQSTSHLNISIADVNKKIDNAIIFINKENEELVNSVECIINEELEKNSEYINNNLIIQKKSQEEFKQKLTEEVYSLHETINGKIKALNVANKELKESVENNINDIREKNDEVLTDYFTKQKQDYKSLEEQIKSNNLILEDNIRESLELANKNIDDNKSIMQKQIISAIDKVEQQSFISQQELKSEFTTQSQKIQYELQQMSTKNTSFKNDIEHQFSNFVKKTLDSLTTQNHSIQEQRVLISSVLQKLDIAQDEYSQDLSQVNDKIINHQIQQDRRNKNYFISVFFLTLLILGSIGWQVVLYYSLV